MYPSVYLASRFQARAEIADVAQVLRDRGIIVTSRWLEEADVNVLDNPDPVACMAIAERDYEDIDRADVVVVFSPKSRHGTGSGGFHWEGGYAKGQGKPVIVCGERENVFHYSQYTVPDVQALINWLSIHG